MVRVKTLVYFNRTVPIGIGKKPRHIPEIHNDEMVLAFLLPQTGAASDNLFELRHGTDHFVENDQLCHLAVRAGRKQF